MKESHTFDGNAETLKNPLGNVWSWDYNDKNDLLWSKTPRQAAGSVQTTYEYWAAGQGSGKPEGYLRKVTDATGKELVTEVLYDGHSQAWKVKDGLDRVSEYTFDGDGDLTLAKRPDGTQTTAVYDDYGNPTSVTGPDSQTTALEYDGMGRFLKATAPGSAATDVGLDDGSAEYTPGVSELRSGTTTFSHSGLKSMGAQSDAGATSVPTGSHQGQEVLPEPKSLPSSGPGSNKVRGALDPRGVALRGRRRTRPRSSRGP